MDRDHLSGTSKGQRGTPFLMACIKKQRVAIPCQFVREVVLMPNVTAIPRTPPHVRGIINLRGMVVPLADLRMLFGVALTAQEHSELHELLKARAEDHKKWVAELEACIVEKREFNLARDPHKCAFGKWYDTFKPENDTITFRSVWTSLDGPHKRIHAIAEVALGHAQRGEYAQAREIIDQTRAGALNEVCALFDEVATTMRQTNREVAIVIAKDSRLVAVSADKVDRAEEIAEADIEPLEERAHGGLVEKVAKRTGSKELALLLNVDAVFGSLVKGAAQGVQGVDSNAAAASK